VTNLSNIQLSSAETSLLSKGLNFIPTGVLEVKGFSCAQKMEWYQELMKRSMKLMLPAQSKLIANIL